MFEINYKIVCSEYDEYFGQNGFFSLICNDKIYGEFYSKEIENIMDKVSIYDWFERMIRVVENLIFRNYIVLSDVESYNTWIEFVRFDDNLTISLVYADKPDGTSDIETELGNFKYGEWSKEVVSFNQFKENVFSNARQYVDAIIALSQMTAENTQILKLTNLIENMA